MEKQFEFNDCGVCINPNRYSVERFNEVTTALRPDGKWAYGVNYQLDTFSGCGGGWLPSERTKECYSTEREAAMAAIKAIEASIAHQGYARGDKHRAGIDACIEYVYTKFNQLTLF